MRVHLCGVRGSTPAVGPEFVRVGGHTSCVAIAHDDATLPTLVLDGGTGLRRLSTLLRGEPFRGVILLSHLHWDHIQGLPFFPAGDRADAQVSLVVPEQANEPSDPLALLSRCMGPPFFPVTPAELRGRWTFATIGEGVHRIDGFDVLAREIPHPGGRTFGYRITDGRSSLAYLSDHGPLALGPGPHGWGPYHEAAMDLVTGVDLLLHDSHYTADELPAYATFGHSAAEYAVELAERGGVRHLALFHLDPLRTDDEVEALAARLQRPGLRVEATVEGATIPL